MVNTCAVCGRIITVRAKRGIVVLSVHGPRARRCEGSRSIQFVRRLARVTAKGYWRLVKEKEAA